MFHAGAISSLDVTSYSEAVRPLLANAAVCEVIGVRIIVVEGLDGHQVRLDYDVRLKSETRSTRIIFDHLSCPVPIRPVETAGLRFRDLAPDTGQRLFCFEAIDGDLPSRLHLGLDLEWSGTSHPYLVFPECLPKPARIVAVPGDYLVAPLSFHPASDKSIDIGGIQLRDGSWNPMENDQAQVVLMRPGSTSYNDASVLVAGPDATAAVRGRYEQIAAEFTACTSFVANLLGTSPSTKCVAFVDNNHEGTNMPAGALIVADADFFGIPDGDFRVLSSQGTQRIASIWWGAGVTVPGHLGAGLSLGICRAVMFWRLHSERRDAHLSFYTKRDQGFLQNEIPANPSIISHGAKFGLELTASLFDAMRSKPAVRRELLDMTREYWGSTIDPRLVINRLHQSGVVIPKPTADLRAELGGT